MKRILFTAFFLLNVFAVSMAYCETIEVQSEVASAIVYTNSAQITRQAQVGLKQGLNEVIFTNVPENLNESTLTVSAKGQARAKILDAQIKTIHLEEAESEKVRQLEDEIEKVKDQIKGLNNKQAVIREEREFLKSIKLHAAQQIPEDLITKTPSAQELAELSAFLSQTWQTTFSKEMEIKKELRDLEKKLAKLKKDLADLWQARRKDKRVISVEFDVEKPGSLTVEASYLMYQAGWRPEYDARVNEKDKSVALSCFGIVKQTSGEDWKGIDLSLSTAKPTVSGKMPELKSWILRKYEMYKRDRKKAVFGLAEKAATPMADMAGVDKLQIEEEKMAEALVQRFYAESEEKLTSVNYKIKRAADIKTDGTKHKLPIFSKNLSSEFQYSTTPKLSLFAYLVAKTKNKEEQLLPANMRVFLDDVYVGSSRIDAVGKGEEIDLYLGIDEGVKIKREKVKEDKKEVWIAGIKRNNKVVVTTYKITLENYKDKNIKIDVFDHFPVSQMDQIAVKIIDVNPKPAEEDYEDRKGVTRWRLDIAPAKTKEIVYTYQVEYPRDMDIDL